MIKISIILFITSLLSIQLYCMDGNPPQLTITTNGIAQPILLGYYYGDKVFLKDTLYFDKQDKIGIEGSSLHEGLYLLIIEGEKPFEFIYDNDTTVKVQISKNKDQYTFSIEGNKQVTDFDGYVRFLNKTINDIKSIKSSPLVLPEERSELIDSIENLTDRKKDSIITRNPGTFVSAHFKASKNIDIKKLLNEKLDTNIGIEKKLLLYQNHFLDNIVWDQASLIYSPNYQHRIDIYLDKISSQKSKTLIERIDKIITKSSSDQNLYKFTLDYLLNKYGLKKNHQEYEKVYMHIIDRYFLSANSPDWISHDKLALLKAEYKTLSRLAVGQTFPVTTNLTSDNKLVATNETKREFTLFLFWDFSSSVNKQIYREVKKTFNKYSYIDIAVYTIFLGDKSNSWETFVDNESPKGWINTKASIPSKTKFIYNISLTPTIMVTDENNDIVMKNILIKELDEFLFGQIE